MSWELIAEILLCAQTVWIFCYLGRSILKARTPRFVRWIFFEARPFMPVVVIGSYLAGGIAHGTDGMGGRLINLVLGLLNWWFARKEKDDDDRWKKRLEAMGDKVSDLGHRLVVVPGGSR